ncbi:hypothetical protein D5086_017766 [Populus alba]|uniref:Uncharacterized protein n=1 Tax=Populus alba TaxID=43335 RepID=A0ACC4BP60_POPAL
MMIASFKSLRFLLGLFVSLTLLALAQEENQFIYHGFTGANLLLSGIANIHPNDLMITLLIPSLVPTQSSAAVVESWLNEGHSLLQMRQRNLLGQGTFTCCAAFPASNYPKDNDGVGDKFKAAAALNADVHESSSNKPPDGNIRNNIKDVTIRTVKFLRQIKALWPADGNSAGDLKIIMGQVGWPTDGNINADTKLAKTFHDGLLKEGNPCPTRLIGCVSLWPNRRIRRALHQDISRDIGDSFGTMNIQNFHGFIWKR